MTTTFRCFQDAYLTQLRETFHRPEFRNAPRGNPSSERIGVNFRLTDPVQRHVSLPARRVNPVFNVAEALWYLSGSRDLSFIGYYAPGIARYSADGRTLQGTAYGPRIFEHRGLNQWENVRRTLGEDRDSKRAVIQIIGAHELAIAGNIDVACTLALQFMIRDDTLCGVGFMRANDAFRGMVSDVFSFTFILEVMARQLGVEVGSYTHQVGSLHVYDSDVDWAQRVLAEAELNTDPPAPMPPMPAGDNWPYIREVLAWEALLRSDSVNLSPAALGRLDLPDYWQGIVGLFEVHRQIKHRTEMNLDVVQALPEPLRSAVVNRWPRVFAAVGLQAALF